MEHIKRDIPLTTSRMLELLEELAAGLDHAHNSRAATSGASVGREGGRAVPARAAGATSAGVPTNTVRVDETPNAYGSCARCNARRCVALCIAEHRRHGDPAGADLPQQRERQLPLRLAKRDLELDVKEITREEW